MPENQEKPEKKCVLAYSEEPEKVKKQHSRIMKNLKKRAKTVSVVRTKGIPNKKTDDWQEGGDYED